eukprot:9490698-Pyramimonas_sp.AAC.1
MEGGILGSSGRGARCHIFGRGSQRAPYGVEGGTNKGPSLLPASCLARSPVRASSRQKAHTLELGPCLDRRVIAGVVQKPSLKLNANRWQDVLPL